MKETFAEANRVRWMSGEYFAPRRIVASI